MIRVFAFDTNSLISANLSPDSVNRKAFDMARQIGIIVYSDSTLLEFSETFTRSKFEKYLTKEKRHLAIDSFKRNGQRTQVFSVINICRDPKDNKFLELAVDAQADCIITGDKDLLVLHPFQHIPIFTASDFLKSF